MGERVEYTEEYAAVRRRLDSAATVQARYPAYYKVEDGAAYLLYLLVRHLRPSLTIEMGVADGRSTGVILAALDANRHGRLVSVDIDQRVGGPAIGHPRWELRVHADGKAGSRQLRQLMTRTDAPDLCFHDAAHTYYNQYSDYRTAWHTMRSGATLISDDIDQSFGFLALMTELNARPVVLNDRTKVVGAVRVP